MTRVKNKQFRHLSDPSSIVDRVWVLFVCVEVLPPSQPNGVMSSAVSLPNHTFNGQALSFKRLTSIVHILSTVWVMISKTDEDNYLLRIVKSQQWFS